MIDMGQADRTLRSQHSVAGLYKVVDSSTNSTVATGLLHGAACRKVYEDFDNRYLVRTGDAT